MNRNSTRPVRRFLALVCIALLARGEGALLAQEAPQGAAAEPAAAKLSPDQLDSLVAPIALYPDSLLAQTLVAATYPLEIIQLQQWLAKNNTLKDKALADAVAKQPWDPSIQSMAAVPEVVKRLADDLQWTTQLGDAFLDQQSDVMDACQRMRKKAADKGALKTNEQQVVETKVVEQKTVIVVQPSDPEVIYVPSYNPTVVYPAPVYPYPPVYYPPPGAALMTFTAGVMIGAAVWGGSCCGCGWGNNDVNINVNNTYNRNSNVNRSSSSNTWQHNSQHRGGAPYSSKSTANKYGGSARGDSRGSSRQSGAQQQGARSSGGRASPSTGTANRSGGGAGASPSAGASSRGGGASPSASSRGGGGGSKGSAAVGGGSGGFSGSSAKASSSRGSSSMSGSRGGGSSRSGGGRKR